jgi:hypothetical protein
MSDKTRLVGLKKGEPKNDNLYKELFVDDSGYRLISSSPKVFSAIHPEDFGEDFYISEDELGSYIEGFTQVILDNIDGVIDSTVKETDVNDLIGDSALNDTDLKLSLYRSFKSLYDKWISSSDYNQQQTSNYFYNAYSTEKSDERMLYEHFNFVNRCGADIGRKAIIDFAYLSNLASTKNGQGPTKSLYESITGVLSKNNFNFLPLPGYITYSNENDDVLEDMFRAFDGPLTKVRANPKFVCMFIGGSSRSLDIPRSYCGINGTDFEYKDDSFDIFDPITYPEDFNNNKTGGITAFKVRYGQETQNHFIKVELDQAEFKETQDSLLVIDALVNPSSGSDPTQIGKGNNLYDVNLTRGYTCKVETLGNMQIQPTMFFKLENVPMFRGTYLITDVSHTIMPHNVKTTFTATRQPIVTVPIVTEALSILDLSLVEVVQTTNQQSTTSTSTTSPTQSNSVIENVSGGPGLDPVVNLTVGKESGGDYEIYNFGESGGGGIRSVTSGSKYNNSAAIKLTDKTVNEILDLQSQGKMFAVGKYQTIPGTLKSVATTLGVLDQPFNKETQDKIGSYLFVGGPRPSLAAYLKGTNNGTEENLRKAVQDLGQEFASMPIIIKDGVTWGNVVTGDGNKAYYGGQGPNPDSVSTSVGTVVKALIKSRIQYSSKNPEFRPSYYSA